ncbi:DUF445 family protein [Sporolactobacillus nakayamae]|uniref:DUF445 family protein n=1 Tax=Sporolactobacillus nakayamae TaxID=269670 RepID=UPI0015A6FD26|nr:DUF445 family protein [Sporolactobacillus nakayamae]
MEKSKKKLANGLIVGAGIGYAVVYPFHQSFTGGLLSSGLSAALVGGLADAFAITGLFRVPMKLNFLKRCYSTIRTEVIPRNREKFISTLVNMVQDDLLSKESLKQYLKKMESEDIAHFVEVVIKNNLNHVKLSPYIAVIRDFSLKNGYEEHVIRFIRNFFIIKERRV